MSISETDFELRPIFMTRLAEETGWSMTGGLETFGRACACVSRSCTIWRAFIRSVPGEKIISIVESPAIDSDWMTWSQGKALSGSASSGTEIRRSSLKLESPSHSDFDV